MSEDDHTGWSAPPPAMGATQLNSLEQGAKRELVPGDQHRAVIRSNFAATLFRAAGASLHTEAHWMELGDSGRGNAA